MASCCLDPEKKKRAREIYDQQEKKNGAAIARELGISVTTACSWMRKWAEEAMEAEKEKVVLPETRYSNDQRNFGFLERLRKNHGIY